MLAERGLESKELNEALTTEEVTLDEASWLEIFGRLSTCRQIGMGLGPIPWLAIHTYCEQQQLDYYDSLILERIMRGMDEAYLTWHKEKEEKEMDKIKKHKPMPKHR